MVSVHGIATTQKSFNSLSTIIKSGRSDTEVANKIKNYYCKGMKVKRNIKQKVTALVPHFIKDDLYTIASCKQEILAFSRLKVKKFWQTGLAFSEINSSIYGAHHGDTYSRTFGKSRDLAISSLAFEDYENGLQDGPVDANQICSENFIELQFIYMPDSGKMLMIPRKLWKNMEFSGFLSLSETCRGCYFEKASQKFLSKQMEAAVLVKYFTLFGPEEITGANIDKKNFIKKVVDNKIDSWYRYFENYASVKEAPDAKNANNIRYEVELNLDNFCQYGRANADLFSH